MLKKENAALLCLEEGRRDGADGSLVMAWRRSDLKPLVALHHLGKVSRLELHRIQNLLYFNMLAALKQAGQAVRLWKLRTTAAINPPGKSLQTCTKMSCCLLASHFRRNLSSRLICDIECCYFLAGCCSLLLGFLPVLALKMHLCAVALVLTLICASLTRVHIKIHHRPVSVCIILCISN